MEQYFDSETGLLKSTQLDSFLVSVEGTSGEKDEIRGMITMAIFEKLVEKIEREIGTISDFDDQTKDSTEQVMAFMLKVHANPKYLEVINDFFNHELHNELEILIKELKA